MGSAILVGVVVSLALLALQVRLTNRAGSSEQVKAVIATVRPEAWHFVALEYGNGILNRTHIVFVTEHVMAGACVRGTLPAPMVVTERWHDPYFYPRPVLVAKYRHIHLESPEFIDMNRANFHLRREQVKDVEFTTEPKWGMGKVPYSGRLMLSLEDGVKKELILLGTQNGPDLRDRLRAGGFGGRGVRQE
ncbi:MAG: hypothetical protein ABTD50_13660 [Polyangiaceae bacterium]|jgi:hypothetical protein